MTDTFLVRVDEMLMMIDTGSGGDDRYKVVCTACASSQSHMPLESFDPSEPEPTIDAETAERAFGVNLEDDPPWMVHCPDCSNTVGEIFAPASEE